MGAIRLKLKTEAAWARSVSTDLASLLSDHAHCEIQAATSAQALILKNPEDGELVRELGAVAIEELEHFQRVTELLAQRGLSLGPARPNPYVAEILRRSGPSRRSSQLDRLLVAGIIEARSLERFMLLAEHLEDAELAAFYGELVPSEAGHQALFLRLSLASFGRGVVEARLEGLLELEAEVVAGLPFEVRMHSGLPPVPAY